MPTKSLDFGLFTIKSFYLKAFHPGNFFTYTHRGVSPGCGPGWFLWNDKVMPSAGKEFIFNNSFSSLPNFQFRVLSGLLC